MKEHLTGIQHIGIPTERFVDTVAFYEALGFETVHRNIHGEEQRPAAFLKLHSLMLEIYEDGKTAGIAGAVDHFAVDVKGIDELYRKMGEGGYRFVTDGIQELPFWEKGIRYFIVAGINEEKIEFCERLV